MNESEIRQLYASKALMGLMAPHGLLKAPLLYAKEAFDLADAMIAEEKRRYG